MKKTMKAILFLFLPLILCSFEYSRNPNNTIENNDTITNNVHFAASDRNTKKAIEGVKLIVINTDGEVISILTTDKKGEAEKKITAPIDKRYLSTDETKSIKRGTVTAIAYKDGYREVVLFEVPVTSFTSFQPIAMSSIIAGQRNEPEVVLGNNHHLEIYSLVNKYSQFLKDKGHQN